MIIYKWPTVPYLLTVLLLHVPLTNIQAAPLLLAESATVVNCNGTISGSNVLVPGFTTDTCSVLFPSGGGTLGSDASASTTGWIRGDGSLGNPLHMGRAEVSGANTGSLGGSMSASAQLIYFFRLVSTGMPPPPVSSVTINLGMDGGGSGAQYYAEARTTWGINGALTDELITTTFNPDPPFSDVHTLVFGNPVTSPLDWEARIWLTATCGAGPGVGATCDAFVDPIFSFEDPAMAEFYAFEFSPNMPIIPVPAAVWLFGSGLIGLICVARRKAA